MMTTPKSKVFTCSKCGQKNRVKLDDPPAAAPAPAKDRADDKPPAGEKQSWLDKELW
jgi:hypothetical protein